MNARASQSGRAPWVGVAVLLLLAVGLGIALFQSGIVKNAPRSGTPDAGDRVIAQALRQAAGAPDSGGSPPPGHVPVDSVAYKHRWLDEVRGVDASGLDAPRRELFLRFANARECTCGCGYTLAGCKASDMTCEVSGPALTALLDSIRAGRITSARGIRARPRIGGGTGR